MYCLTVLEAEILPSRGLQGHVPSEGAGEGPVPVLSAGDWGSPGLWQHNSSLHIGIFPVCKSVSKFISLFCKDSSHIVLGAHLISV